MSLTDFYELEALLDDNERETLHGVREFLRTEVQPVVTEYWSKAEFPFQLIPKIAELDINGWPYQGYGCPGGSYLFDGMLAMEFARCDPSLSTFRGVHSGLSMGSIYLCGSGSRRSAGCRRCGGWRRSAPSRSPSRMSARGPPGG